MEKSNRLENVVIKSFTKLYYVNRTKDSLAS
jgi:hypothetical protein